MSFLRLLGSLTFGLSALAVTACAGTVRDTGVVDGAVVVFERSGSDVQSLNARTGKPIASWSHDRDGSFQTVVSSLVTGRPLVISHGLAGVAVHDAHTGEVAQRIFMRLHPEDRPCLSRTAMFLPAWNEAVGTPWNAVRSEDEPGAWVGFDLRTGRRTLDLRADRYAPLVANDDVLSTMENGALVGYSAEDGRERWRSQVAVVAPVALSGNHLLVELPDDKLGVFIASSGALERTLEPGSDVFGTGLGGAPNLRASRGFAGALTGEGLSVIKLSSGQTVFKEADARAFSFAGERLVVLGDAEIRALDLATGSVKWKAPITDVTSLASDGELTAVGGRAGLTVFDTQTGKKVLDQTASP